MALNAEDAVQAQSILCLVVFPLHPQGNPTKPWTFKPRKLLWPWLD